MLFDSSEPITVPCAKIVEPAIHSLLRLGIMQEEFVDHVSRALGIVRCVLDHEQSIPRKKLAALGRSLWARMPHLPDVPEGAVEQVRTIIMACVEELRELSDSIAAPAEVARPPPTVNCRAWSADSTGVFPLLIEYFGPRTAAAGFTGITCPTTK